MPRFRIPDTLALAPTWQKAVLGLVVLTALGGAGYFVVIAPVESRVSTLGAERDAQRQELVRLRAVAVELTRVRREAAEVERQLEIAKEKLPTEREIPALYRVLSDAAVQAGLAVGLFRPQGSTVRDFYSEIPISVVAEGGYHEVGDFIGRVAALPRATMVGEMKLVAPGADAASASATPSKGSRPRTPVADEGKPRRSVRAEMTLLTYVYRPVGSPPAPKPPAVGTKPEPAKP